MENFNDLSTALGINSSELNNIVNYSDTYYKNYYIQKKNGDKRTISAPGSQLKAIQRWILNHLLCNFSTHSRANGFIKGRGIKRNATYHLDKKFILILDIKNFFPSITQDGVYKIFLEKFNNTELSYKMAKLLCYKKRLPQGAPTSPMISNIFFNPLDEDIVTLCNKSLINYSRYADDLTFSSDNKQDLLDIVKPITEILAKENFFLNDKKTRIFSGKSRMVVTGIVINSGRLSIGRKTKKFIRSEIYKLIILGDTSINKNKLIGYLCFLNDIEPETFKRFKEYIQYLKNNKAPILIKVSAAKNSL